MYANVSEANMRKNLKLRISQLCGRDNLIDNNNLFFLAITVKPVPNVTQLALGL